MFARIHPAEVSPEAFDSVVSFAETRLPDFETQQGFKGFYLMTDRESGELVTISFWETLEDVRLMEAGTAHAHAAEAAAAETVVAATPVKTYRVEIARSQ
jgi:heme-degrading monooxygenase HmoA